MDTHAAFYVLLYTGSYIKQGSHMLEKYLDLEGLLEKSLVIKSAVKSTGKTLICLVLLFSVGLNTVDRERSKSV